MDIIYILGLSQAVFLSLLIFSKKEKSQKDYVLGVWLAFMGLHLLTYYFHSSGLDQTYPHLLHLGAFFPMLEGPLMFVYVLVTVSETGKLKPVYLLHGLPFLILNAFFLFDFYLLGAEQKLAYYLELTVNPNAVMQVGEFLNRYLGPVYVVLSLVKLQSHKKAILKRFSYTEEIDLTWLRYVLAGLGFVWITVMVGSLLKILGSQTELATQITYASATIAIFFLGYYGIKQQVIYTQPLAESEPPEKPSGIAANPETDRYRKSGLKKEAAEKYLKALLEYMEEEKAYLNGKLSLKDVAGDLGISVNYLSQVINELLQQSFFDFVNTYRVEEVKRLLNEAQHERLTLLAIAYDSGFNSKSSFNHIFKSVTGVTPSEYVKLRQDQHPKSQGRLLGQESRHSGNGPGV